jgi:tRNA pseudouridine38-40 synthase
LDAKDRKLAGVTAVPNGLYFKGVYYPKRHGIDVQDAFKPLAEIIENKPTVN